MKKQYAWKVLKKGMVSDSRNNCKWIKGQWKTHKKDLELCRKGFHASESLFDAINYVTPGIICLVEYDGKTIKSNDQFVCERMRVIKTFKFTKRNAVEWSIYCAKLCLKNFEKKFPKDKRPRLAIKAAEAWLKNPTKKNKSAAESAAESARFAAGAAKFAAESARSAEFAARSVGFAAWSARFAAWSARFAAWSARFAAGAVESATKKKMSNKLMKIIGYK